MARPGAQSRFDRRITSQSYTLGTIATSPLVITVGAYDANAEGRPLAPFSSCGPTRDERHSKPELLAPGVGEVAARSIPRDAVQQDVNRHISEELAQLAGLAADKDGASRNIWQRIKSKFESLGDKSGSTAEKEEREGGGKG